MAYHDTAGNLINVKFNDSQIYREVPVHVKTLTDTDYSKETYLANDDFLHNVSCLSKLFSRILDVSAEKLFSLISSFLLLPQVRCLFFFFFLSLVILHLQNLLHFSHSLISSFMALLMLSLMKKVLRARGNDPLKGF